MEQNFDVIIIGAGPAGLTAGIYAARGGQSVAIVERGAVGGLASLAHSVENYPGFEKISGFDLCYKMFSQCQSLGATFFFDEIKCADLISKQITLASGDVLRSKRVIIATGASPKPLGLENEKKFTGRGVSYCATCDGALYKGKTVAVVGGGNTAVEDALYLENLAKKVYLIHRRDALRADEILATRLKCSSVEILWDSVVTRLVGKDKLTQIEVKNVKNDTLSPFLVDCLFVAIGQKPNVEGFDGLELKDGYILTNENMQTSLPGVYAAGDVRFKSLRQIVTACSDGAIAAKNL